MLFRSVQVQLRYTQQAGNGLTSLKHCCGLAQAQVALPDNVGLILSFAGHAVIIAIKPGAISRIAAPQRRSACRSGRSAVSKVSAAAAFLRAWSAEWHRSLSTGPMAMVLACLAIVVAPLRIEPAGMREAGCRRRHKARQKCDDELHGVLLSCKSCLARSH